jgi:shikimate dehydrogenase
MAIGAVNTILFEAGGPRGYNTDYSGFKAAFCHVLRDVRPGPVCMIGAGGVGKAVAFGLVALGLRDLRLVELDQAKANQLASALNASNPDLQVSVSDQAAGATDGVDGLINCTPVGMVGHDGTPLSRDLMAGARWAFDAVYTPANTRFLQDAEAEGLTIISGYELFFYQGVHAWRLFSGQPVDLAALRQRLSDCLAERAA